MTSQAIVTPSGHRAQTFLPALRGLLVLDATTCLLMGALLLAAAAPLAPWLGLPQPLLWWAGVLLVPCAALMGATAAMRRPLPGLVWLVILGNAAWVLASLGVLVIHAPTGLGLAFVLAQAGVVTLLLALERRALAASA